MDAASIDAGWDVVKLLGRDRARSSLTTVASGIIVG
jgi:hypothetical protein